MRTIRSIHKKLSEHFLRRINLMITAVFGTLVIMFSVFVGGVAASPGTTLRMVINPGNLSVGIVDLAFRSVSAPTVKLTDIPYQTSCQTSKGLLGTQEQQIYIANPAATNNGWTVTLSAPDPSMAWQSGKYALDFNDPNALGCVDGDDSDNHAGILTIDPSPARVVVGQCNTCVTDNIILGNSAQFIEGKNDVITVLSGSPESDDIGDWILTGIEIRQTIPAGQPAAGEYTLPLSLSITAQ